MKVYVGAPAAACQYLEADRGRADDYYLTEGSGVARRYAVRAGQLVELAPLAGDGYEAWVAGRDPETGLPRGRLRTDDRAVRFVEVVVNGPKSWSLAAALHPDIAVAYDAAQDRAAAQIVSWLAEHATTRVGPRGGQEQVPVDTLEAVAVRHYTSRAGDPHRHLHLQINARVFAAEQWRGLHTIGVRDFLGAINGIGHAAVATDPHFRAALAAHGYTLDGIGEVRQLADFVGPFSARAAQIARNQDRYQREWQAAHPGAAAGPALRRAWDARAWADGRPDKISPQPGSCLTGRWLAELAALGYRDLDRPVDLITTPVGALDRTQGVERVLARLAAGRSAWNAADIRGEVEQLIAAAGIVADGAVRIELAEDLTARAMERCLPLLLRDGLPEHIRAWTSRPVLHVEADLTARFDARSTGPGTDAPQALVVVAGHRAGGLDAGQVAAVAALAGDRALVVVEGAAGAGKTTTLAATGELLAARGRRLVVVTPTLKAAKVAAAELGTAAGSAARLVFQHGWRWDQHGAWTRLSAGQADPVTGHIYAGPEVGAQLHAGDLLVVDEAGMLDQDTARALLVVADECRARVALIGDRHQLAAVGRGGVLDLAARAASPAAVLTLQTVHRFTHTDQIGHTVPDREYADLTLAMRSGTDPGAVFDAVCARGQIRLHPDMAELQENVAAISAGHHSRGERVAVVVDTGEQVDELNAAIRDRLVAAGLVDDTRVALARDGQRIGAGDRIATRRNDRDLGVANRDLWTVTAVGRHGQLTVIPAGAGPAAGEWLLPSDYVTAQVQLAYATTAHGTQGDTVPAGHLVIGEHTGAASAYVGMTRGRTANTAHLVAADLADARQEWTAAFARDRADLGPGHAAQLAAAEAARYASSRPLEKVLADLHSAWTAEQHCLDHLSLATSRRDLLREIVTRRNRDEDRLTTLEVTCGRTAVAAEDARQRADASTAAIATEAIRLRESRLAAWDAQRDAARQAACVVLRGPGRLGLRRAAFARGSEQLSAWADAWRPFLPALSSDPLRIAAVADAADDRPRLQAVFHTHACRHAETSHPEHSQRAAAADAAQAAHDRARRELDHARREHSDLLARSDATGRPLDPMTRLADAEREVVGTQQELAAARTRIEQLQWEPAIFRQPAGSLATERDRWRARHDREDVTTRPPTSLPARPQPVVRPPVPEDLRPLARHPGTGLGAPR